MTFNILSDYGIAQNTTSHVISKCTIFRVRHTAGKEIGRLSLFFFVPESCAFSVRGPGSREKRCFSASIHRSPHELRKYEFKSWK